MKTSQFRTKSASIISLPNHKFSRHWDARTRQPTFATKPSAWLTHFSFTGCGVIPSEPGVLRQPAKLVVQAGLHNLICVDVGAGTPNLPVGDQATPDFSAIYQRTMVVERDVGDANSLRHNRVLAWAWQLRTPAPGPGPTSASI